MEMLWAITPFFLAGFFATVYARFTGINISMCVLFSYLYMGATPVECIVGMLMFNVFTYFTTYTQIHRMNVKSMVFFPGIRMAIPVLLTIAIAALNAFLGIIFFIFCFLMEIFAKSYKEMTPKVRPEKQQLIKLAIIAGVVISVGVAIVQFVPENYYYILAGIAVLLYTALMWFAGDRHKWSDVWDRFLYGTIFAAGLTGIDGTDWLQSMQRSKSASVLSRCYPIVINGGMIIALVVSYLMYHYFSLGALFATIGSAVGVRLFGLTEYSTKGKFSYVTMGLAVLTALVFMILQPVPSGFPVIPMADESMGFFQF
jgi:hypothetical protein